MSDRIDLDNLIILLDGVIISSNQVVQPHSLYPFLSFDSITSQSNISSIPTPSISTTSIIPSIEQLPNQDNSTTDPYNIFSTSILQPTDRIDDTSNNKNSKILDGEKLSIKNYEK